MNEARIGSERVEEEKKGRNRPGKERVRGRKGGIRRQQREARVSIDMIKVTNRKKSEKGSGGIRGKWREREGRWMHG